MSKKIEKLLNKAKESAGIIRFATILGFWTMVILWEIEAMRLLWKREELQGTNYDLLTLLNYDATMVFAAIFTFLSSIFYLFVYENKKFGMLAFVLSFLLILFVMFLTVTGINPIEVPLGVLKSLYS